MVWVYTNAWTWGSCVKVMGLSGVDTLSHDSSRVLFECMRALLIATDGARDVGRHSVVAKRREAREDRGRIGRDARASRGGGDDGGDDAEETRARGR